MISQLLAAYTGNDFMRELKNVLILIFGAAGALCTLYAIYIGYLFATASDEAKRRTAKNRFIKILSTALIITALALVIAGTNLEFNTDYVKNNSGSGETTDDLKEIETSGIIYNETPFFEFYSSFDVDYYCSVELYPNKLTKVDDRTNYKNKAFFESFQFEGVPADILSNFTMNIEVNEKNGRLTIKASMSPAQLNALKECTSTSPYYEKVGEKKDYKYWKAKAGYRLDGVLNTVDIYMATNLPVKYEEKPVGSFGLLS